MRLIAVRSKNYEKAKILLSLIQEKVPDIKVHIFESTKDLLIDFQGYFNNSWILLIIMLDNSTELSELSTLREFSKELYIIVLTTDEKDETIRIAHTLRPHYVAPITTEPGNFIILLNGVLDAHNKKAIK
jgi:hypothetical protein